MSDKFIPVGEVCPDHAKTRDLSTTTPEDNHKFFAMMGNFVYQIGDDVLREQMEAALKRERSRYDGTW